MLPASFPPQCQSGHGTLGTLMQQFQHRVISRLSRDNGHRAPAIEVLPLRGSLRPGGAENRHARRCEPCWLCGVSGTSSTRLLGPGTDETSKEPLIIESIIYYRRGSRARGGVSLCTPQDGCSQTSFFTLFLFTDDRDAEADFRWRQCKHCGARWILHSGYYGWALLLLLLVVGWKRVTKMVLFE